MRKCEVRDLGCIGYGEAFELQRRLADERKRGAIPDQFLLVEHHHVLTLGRNGHLENLLVSGDVLRARGVEFFETDRGGDITYHGPGQIVGYPILDLREWKRDVVAYVRGLEQVLIDSLAEFGMSAGRVQGATGVWVENRKIAAIGVHLSRWVTSHGFALNVDTDLSYFQLIVPCGLTKPVTSMHAEGVRARRQDVAASIRQQFAKIFEVEITETELEKAI
jgi:lipoate-protein ligase B